MGGPRLITLRYSGWCARCGTAQPAGTTGWWHPGTRAVTCTGCTATAAPAAGAPAAWPPGSVAGDTGPGAVAPPTTASPGPGRGTISTPGTDQAPPVWPPAPPTQRVYGHPGASARSMYEKRRRNDRERARRAFPLRLAVVALCMVLAFVAVQLVDPVVRLIVHGLFSRAGDGGGVHTAPLSPALGLRFGLLISLAVGLATALTLWGRRPTTEAWAAGSRGEEDLGWQLDRLAGSGRSLCVVHDRRLPGRGGANLDHLVVAPSGVHVVDAKRWSGGAEIRGGRRGPRLLAGGRDRTAKVSRSMASQAAAVVGVLRQQGWTAVPVHRRVVLVGRGLGWLAGPGLVEEVWIGSCGELAGELDRPGPLADDQVLALGRLLADRLPPA